VAGRLTRPARGPERQSALITVLLAAGPPLHDPQERGDVNRSAAAVRGFSPDGPSVFRLTAVDATGNASRSSGPVVVWPAPRPTSSPHAIPNWAFQLAAWQQANRNGKRPPAPRQVPGWYWRWHGWRLHPFHVTS